MIWPIVDRINDKHEHGCLADAEFVGTIEYILVLPLITSISGSTSACGSLTSKSDPFLLVRTIGDEISHLSEKNNNTYPREVNKIQ